MRSIKRKTGKAKKIKVSRKLKGGAKFLNRIRGRKSQYNVSKNKRGIFRRMGNALRGRKGQTRRLPELPRGTREHLRQNDNTWGNPLKELEMLKKKQSGMTSRPLSSTPNPYGEIVYNTTRTTTPRTKPRNTSYYSNPNPNPNQNSSRIIYTKPYVTKRSSRSNDNQNWLKAQGNNYLGRRRKQPDLEIYGDVSKNGGVVYADMQV